ncbi:MAG: family acetyltransferase [Bacillota bacterium]|nr:family acetyltransferase [Bacillota bacterium]
MEFKKESERIYIENEIGKTIAEITFPHISDDVVNIDHTFVDQSLRGQGVAGKLMLAVTEHLRNNNQKAKATCSYAVDWFDEHNEYDDIYIK